MPPRTRWITFLFSALAIWLLALPAAEQPAGIDPASFLEHVKYLASEEMRGRASGGPELEKAADYIESRFRELGLQPAGRRPAYGQQFAVSINSHIGGGNELAYRWGRDRVGLRFGSDFTPLSFSGRGKASGRVVFAGYGISAPEYGYDDYAGLDTKGKIVVLLRHEPQEFDRDSVFAGKIYTEHSQLFSKAANARERGATGVILVNDTVQHGGGDGDLTEFSEFPGPAASDIPLIHVEAEAVRDWFRRAGRDFDATQNTLNRDLRPNSFEFPPELRVNMRSDVRGEERAVRNVAAYLPGTSEEYIILGAHYDHIGLGEQFSMLPSAAGTLHPGADDNASGVAGLLELAAWFANHPKQKRGLLFVAFAGEELGLLGSSHYIRHPLRPLLQAVAMINMDMIGRIEGGKVYVGGSSTGSNLLEILERHLPETEFEVDFSDTVGYGSSDHTAFTTREIPVLFFFSGLHGDYHRPSDTWDKIRPVETARMLDYIALVVGDLAQDEGRPEFVHPEANRRLTPP